VSRATDFGDVGALPEGLAHLVRASAAIGAGREDVLRGALVAAHGRAGQGGPDRAAIEEMLLQTHLFAGYPATIKALSLWRGLAGAASGPAADEPATDERPEEWDARGAEVCRRVYGGQYERLRGHVASLHPDLERWMVRDGYGRVLGRPGLPLRDRELCVVALLCGQDAEPQLYSHLRGALQVGATEEEVEAVLRIAGALVPAERRESAWRVWTTLVGRSAHGHAPRDG
jgi:4-carboxymuconolactone decarboxylase